MRPLSLILFALLWLAIVYFFNCLVARQFKKIDPKQAILYFMTVAMIGVSGEIFLDTVYNHFVGQPLWRYNILPIHDGYTSAYAPITWGLYGLHLYLLHGTLGKWAITRIRHLTLIFSIEALIIESLLTLSAYLLLGEYMYYYYPGDLWHVTTIQNMPFYFICGAVVLMTIRRFMRSPVFFSALSAFLTIVFVFFTH